MNRYTEKNVFPNNENFAIDFRTSPSEDTHLHDFLELVYIVRGKGDQYIDGKKYPVIRGDMLFINYNHTHAFDTKRGMEYYNIYLKPSLISENLINTNNAMQILALTDFEDFQKNDRNENPIVRFYRNESLEIETCLSAMLREYHNKSDGTNTVLKAYLMILLTYFFRKVAMREISQRRIAHNNIGDLIQYIETHCTQHLTLTELSEKCFYNPSYFCRIFKEYSGKTVTELIHENRIKHACVQLASTQISIEEISRCVGYTNRTQFYKKFQEFIGMSPAEYRKSHYRIQE